MKTYQYTSYKEYRNSQISTNLKKIKGVYSDSNTISKLITSLENKEDLQDILCHGVRNGKETLHFTEALERFNVKAKVVGTELSKECVKRYKDQYPENIKLITWDMNKNKKEWENKFDIVYSNSLDHSYDLVKTITNWGKQVKPKGYLCIEWDILQNNQAHKEDPQQASYNEIIFLVQKHTECKFNFAIDRVVKNFSIPVTHTIMVCGANSKVLVFKKI